MIWAKLGKLRIYSVNASCTLTTKTKQTRRSCQSPTSGQSNGSLVGEQFLSSSLRDSDIKLALRTTSPKFIHLYKNLYILWGLKRFGFLKCYSSWLEILKIKISIQNWMYQWYVLEIVHYLVKVQQFMKNLENIATMLLD